MTGMMLRVRAVWKNVCIYLIIISVSVTMLCLLLIGKNEFLKAPDTVYPVIRVPLQDTLTKPRSVKILREHKDVLKHNRSGTLAPKVVVQINKRLLTMIEDIERSDTTTKGMVKLEGISNYTCPPKPRIVNGVEDLLCMKPPRFLPNYKNPCWNSSEGTFTCLPYFQVIGIDKSGSTDLFDRIARHPDVLKNRGAIEKETMWWSWYRYGHLLRHRVKVQPFKQYTKYFETAAKTIRPQPGAGIITGDGTPMDIWDMSGWVSIPQNIGQKEPKFITPHLIKHVNPNVKLLVILRDPVERLFSDYIFLKMGKQTINGFHDEVVRSIKLLHMCTRKHSLRRCLYERNLHLHLKARIHVGFYSMLLKDWLKVFPREQFLIMRTEDYSDKTKDHLLKAFSFLGLRNLPDSVLEQFVDAERKHVTKGKKSAGKMLEKTRLILERLYKSYNSELADILKDQRFVWKQKT